MITFGSITAVSRPVESQELETESRDRAIPTAELAECNCPEFCDRDHETD